MIYFDLPAEDDDEEEEETVTKTAGVADFWRFLLHFFILQWLGAQGQTKRIKNE